MLTIVALVSTAGAAAYVEEWDGGTIEGWNIENIDGGASYATLDWNTAPLLGGQYEVLRIEGGGVQGGIIEDIIYADSGSSGGNIAGNIDYTGGYYVSFDFYASEEPISIDVYFEGAGVQWIISVDLPSTGWNYNYLQMLTYDSDWTRLDGGDESAANFITSLQDVDEIGLVISYTGSGTEVYALDDFTVVPEPGEWLMIGIVLLSLSFVFRKKLSEALVAVRVSRY